METENKTLILLSGGLDSVTLLYDIRSRKAADKITCLIFDYKQRHAQELMWAKEHAKRCGVIFITMELPQLGGLTEQSWIVPNRNACFISVGVNVACQIGARELVIGCNSDDAESFPDCRKEFLDAMGIAVRAAGYDVEICAPFLNRSKYEIGKLANKFLIKSNEIWTCYAPKESKPCGECPACNKLKTANICTQ